MTTARPPAPSLLAHLIVRGDCGITCHRYDDHGPILSVGTSPTSVMLSLAGTGVSAGDLTFAHALVDAANTFLAECERLAESGGSAA